MRATTRWAGALLVGGLLLGGCAGDTAGAGDGPVADPPPVDATDEPAATGTRDPDATGPEGTDDLADDHPLAFTARQLGGGSLDAAELAGGHVVLWLWTPW